MPLHSLHILIKETIIMVTAEAPHPVPSTDHCLVTAGTGPRLQVRLRGVLAADWAGHLAAALAARRISIVRLDGERHAGRLWEINLLVESLDPTADASALDYLALARDPRPMDTAMAGLGLEAFSLTRTDDALLVDVEAVDSLGFLDRILRVFALFALFPRALDIETRGRKVRDRFTLVNRDGRSPSLQLCEAVGLQLHALAD
jgi:hypothetical protein